MQSDNSLSSSFSFDPSSSDVARLRRRLNGKVTTPGDPGYDAARKVWNGAVDKRPAMVVYCANTADVIEAVRFAQSGGHLVAVPCWRMAGTCGRAPPRTRTSSGDCAAAEATSES